MGLFRHFSKAAFVCNICFLIALFILHTRRQTDQELSSLVIVMGFFLAVVLNVVVNVWLGGWLIRKKTWPPLPAWLGFSNFIFLVLQLIFILK